MLVSQKGNGKRRGFSANTLCQLINCIYRGAGIAGATSHSARRGFITISVTPEQKRKAVELVS